MLSYDLKVSSKEKRSKATLPRNDVYGLTLKDMYGGVRNIEERQYSTALQHGQNYALVRKLHESLKADVRMVTQNSLDIRLEKIRRKKRTASDFVNGKYYPQPSRFGYRLTNLPQRTLTLDEIKELAYNLNEYLKGESE